MRARATIAALAVSLPAAAITRQHLGPPVPAQVRRIVTLAPSLSEIVLALGAGDRLVGVTRFDDDPRVAKLPRVGGYNDPEPETVLGLHPDLILAQPAPENRGPVETLARLGVPVEAFALDDLKQIQDVIVQIGTLLGLGERGQALRADLVTQRARMRVKAEGGPHPRVLLVFGLDPLVVAGSAGFAGELLRDVGAVNAASDSDRPFPRLSVEAAVRAQPDVVVVCGFDPPAGRAVIPGLPRVRVERLRSTALLHPGPRLVEGLDDLFVAVHGKRAP